jgi:hypothetical protein
MVARSAAELTEIPGGSLQPWLLHSLTIKKGGKNHFYINRGAEDKMNGGRLVEEEPWLPEQITRRSRLLLPFALVARLEVFAQPSELADLLPSRRALASPEGPAIFRRSRGSKFSHPPGAAMI